MEVKIRISRASIPIGKEKILPHLKSQPKADVIPWLKPSYASDQTGNRSMPCLLRRRAKYLGADCLCSIPP